MSFLEHWLTLWVALCILLGIGLGQWIPEPFQALGRMEVAQVNIPVGLPIWVMIIPMLMKIDFGALHQVREHWKGIGVTLFVNWAIKPFSMALLASVVLYIVIPVILAHAWRHHLLKQSQERFDITLDRLGHISILALLATLVLLFAFQGEAILEQPLIILLLAVPILIQVFFNSALAYWLNRKVGEQYKVACPSALIGASNFF